ncbi:hypothetical protein [Actinoplanes sp. N902-109]|uniref:hypothetical protein n=1 Tax=Actinoplanes sp. (strain N902-109) TaxID=649831 RepID=UPI0012F9DC53|nr:hypothetical protein [Actinoplanes sp. N902-109]
MTAVTDKAPVTDNQVPRADEPAADALVRGWLRRQVAALCMNLLIAVVVAAALWLRRSSGGTEFDGDLALALFAVWCLAFLPGWLYVRFLGQRAGALWDEYVLSLHRLGWDHPGFLPEPPVTSQFHEEWKNDGGPAYRKHLNLYRQKFDAYYGRAVADSSHTRGTPLRIETLFPVFLVTTTLAVCWVVLLLDPVFVQEPRTAWDMMAFGFLGAYSFIFQMLIRRFFQSDLRPSAYAHAMVRIITVLILVAAVHQVMAGTGPRIQAVVAFVIGFFPLVGMQALQRTAAAALRAVVPSGTPAYPLNQIDGLGIWYESRLLEEGIEDMQSLATANLVDVILHTRVPVGRLVDWVDQAHLYLHLDRIDRGWLDRTLHGDKADAGPAGHLSDGSVKATSRAGTKTRTTLRQLGIRKATDLLKAFPADRMAPDVAWGPTQPWYDHLHQVEQQGLNLSQLRTMVQVLSQEASLAAVWNWQHRGVRTRP